MINEYTKIVKEFFDISDERTRKTVINLEDVEQNQLLTALTSALYDKIVEKVDDIDFGTIPASRGDITKVQGFENTVECLNIIRRLVDEYKEDPIVVDVVLQAIDNIRSRKAIFMKAYSANVEFPMVLYNLIVMSIEQSVSFLIAVCIQYIKDPTSQSMSAALDKVAYKSTMNNMLYEQLAKFNASCVGKELDDTLTNIIKNGGKLSEAGEVLDLGYEQVGKKTQEPFIGCCPVCKKQVCECKAKSEDYIPTPEPGQEPIHEPDPVEERPVFPTEEPVNEGIGDIIKMPIKIIGVGFKGIQGLLGMIIPAMRSICYFLINSRVKLSDCLAVQSQLIEINAYKLQYSTTTDLSDEKRDKVVKKQLKIAERLRSWSNKFAIDHNSAKKKAMNMETDDSKKMKVDDIKGIPADVAMAGDLF